MHHSARAEVREEHCGLSFLLHLSKESRDQTQVTRIVWVAPSLQNYLIGPGKTAFFSKLN